MYQVLFVHGMGRSSLSAWPMLWRLRRAGMATSTFDYLVSVEKFDAISARLARVIADLPRQARVVLIGHSLGGVLIRAALQRLPAHAVPPDHVFLLGSPQSAARMARRLAAHPLYRLLTGECGQRLASPEAMAALAPLEVPATALVGMRALGLNAVFGAEANDGVVSLSEVRAPWLLEEVQLDMIHTLLPASPTVARLVLERMARRAGTKTKRRRPALARLEAGARLNKTCEGTAHDQPS